MATPEDPAKKREVEANKRDEHANVRDEQADDRDVIADRHHHILHGYMRLILWVTVILFVGTVVSIFRSYHLESSVEDLDAHTTDLEGATDAARDAAIEARDALAEALAESDARVASGEGASPSAIRDALVAVDRIEQHLCGGPCPVTDEGDS